MNKPTTVRILLSSLLLALLVNSSTAYDLPTCVQDLKNSIVDVYKIADDFLHKEFAKAIPLAFNLVEQVGDAAFVVLLPRSDDSADRAGDYSDRGEECGLLHQRSACCAR